MVTLARHSGREEVVVGVPLANRPHPGKDNESGYFGLAGHNDPVEYRNLSIKKLDN